MTSVPAPAPKLPKDLRKPTKWSRVINSTLFPLAVAIVGLVWTADVAIQGAQNTQEIANTSQQVSAEAQARSELNEAINARIQEGLCDLLVSVGNPSVVPATVVGKENVQKFRRSASVFECPGQVYAIPDSQLQV